MIYFFILIIFFILSLFLLWLLYFTISLSQYLLGFYWDPIPETYRLICIFLTYYLWLSNSFSISRSRLFINSHLNVVSRIFSANCHPRTSDGVAIFSIGLVVEWRDAVSDVQPKWHWQNGIWCGTDLFPGAEPPAAFTASSSVVVDASYEWVYPDPGLSWPDLVNGRSPVWSTPLWGDPRYSISKLREFAVDGQGEVGYDLGYDVPRPRSPSVADRWLDSRRIAITVVLVFLPIDSSQREMLQTLYHDIIILVARYRREIGVRLRRKLDESARSARDILCIVNSLKREGKISLNIF